MPGNLKVEVLKAKLKKLPPLLVLLAIATALFTLRKLAPEQLFLENWMQFFGMALITILPLFLLLHPRINTLVNRFLGSRHLVIQGFAFVLPMMSVMFSMMTALSVYVMMNFGSAEEFFKLFGDELIHNIPTFLIVATIMGGIIKPSIEKKKRKEVRINSDE